MVHGGQTKELYTVVFIIFMNDLNKVFPVSGYQRFLVVSDQNIFFTYQLCK